MSSPYGYGNLHPRHRLEAARERITILESEIDRLRVALRTIQQWDCLNPPATHLCADLPWLRGVVDDALAAEHPIVTAAKENTPLMAMLDESNVDAEANGTEHWPTLNELEVGGTMALAASYRARMQGRPTRVHVPLGFDPDDYPVV